MSDERKCPCGCGKPWDDAISDLIRDHMTPKEAYEVLSGIAEKNREKARRKKPVPCVAELVGIAPDFEAARFMDQWEIRAALLSPEAVEAAEKAVHRNRGLDGSGELAVRAALEVAMLDS